MQFPEIIYQLTKYLPPRESLYLVGGAVRDALLNIPGKDFDFVCVSDTRAIARQFANENKGAFYMLDEERNTCRVLITLQNNERMEFDFAQLRGETIEDDLWERDFTINSMAIDLNSPEHIIDPTKGGRDLQQKWLRQVKPTSIKDDPVRAIRAIRYAVNLDLKIEKETSENIRIGASGLSSISAERKRDELFKILEGEKVDTAFRLMERFSILSEIYFSIEEKIDVACRQIHVLDEMIAILCNKSNVEKNVSFYRTSLLLRLSRFNEQLERHFYQKNLTGRNRKSLLHLFQAMKPIPKTIINSSFTRLALSTDEINALNSLSENIFCANTLFQESDILDNRSIYLYYRKTGETGLDILFLSLADYASKLAVDFSQDQWLRILEMSEILVQAWFLQPEVVAPKPLLNGNDLMFHFDLSPSSLIGEIIESLKEEQAAGNIQTRSDAMEWVDLRLQRNSL